MNGPYPWELPVVRKIVEPKVKNRPPRTRKSDGLAPGTKIWRWRGQDYYGAADVAASVPCDVRTVYKHKRKYGHLENLGDDENGRKINRALPIPVKMELDGKTYEWKSIRAMARDIGWTQASAQRCYNSTGRGRAKLEGAIIEWNARKRDMA